MTARKTAPTRAAARKKTSRTTKARTTKARTSKSRRVKGRTPSRAAPVEKWSKRVTQTSDALDLEQSVFKLPTARAIAASLKRSAERSRRRKSTPYQSAISMLTFYINRGGVNLSATQRRKLERAKGELKTLFGKDAARG